MKPAPGPGPAPGPACLGDWQCLWFHSHKSVGTDPVHLPASAFCCFSIFSRRPSKESILVLICVSSFLIVCNSSDFTGRGKGTESNRKSKARTHGHPVFPPDAVKSQRMLSSPINSDCLQLPPTPRTWSHSDSPGWEPLTCLLTNVVRGGGI